MLRFGDAVTTILWNQFSNSPAPGPRPFVLVTPNGPTDGGDFGPSSTLWSGTGSSMTGGIQEALYWLSVHAPSGAGTVYVTGGSYSISAGIANTASQQVVIFEAGVTLNFSSGASALADANLGNAWFGVASSYGFNSTHTNYSHIAWYGNGCVINLTNAGSAATVFGLFQYGNYDTHGVSPYPGGIDFIVDGFVIPNAPADSAAWFVGVDQYTTLPISGTSNNSNGLLQKIRNIRLSRIFYTVAAGSYTGSPSMMVLQGAWHDVLIEDCSLDSYGVTGTSNPAGLFARANAGDAEQLVVRRCYFRTAAGTKPYPVIIQGNASGNNGSATRNCQQIYVEDTTFDSGLSSPAGFEVFINDTAGMSGNAGFATNFEFRRCTFINCELALNGQTALFGYLRFIDCITGSGSVFPTPNPLSPSLSKRFPMTSNFTTLAALPTSGPYTYPNVDAIEEILVVVGGTVSAVYWGGSASGTSTGTLTGTYRLRPGDSITISYTSGSAPTLYKFAV
jgi:hypothetical protein